MKEERHHPKTANELREEYFRVQRLAEKDIQDLNSGRTALGLGLSAIQIALFIYGLVVAGGIVSLGLSGRWEAYVLMPIEIAVIFALWNWGWLTLRLSKK